MVLQDHFHPPLSARRHWHAFHNAWATYIASDLNQRLPENYFAEPNVQFGIEIDVATFEEPLPEGSDRKMQLPVSDQWNPPAPNQTIPFQPMSESVEISIFNSEAGPVLAGAIELVSPANKDRPQHRDAFVSKCETYLQQGLGLIIVDVVTGRKANLHHALLERLAPADIFPFKAELYAAAYRVVDRQGQSSLDIWQEELEIEEMLPTLPLYLRDGICLPVDLNATYQRTCREQRI
jgi:Protein of unknown function (DUF4058)